MNYEPAFHFTASGASANFLCLPEILPKKRVRGKITFFTNAGIAVISNSVLYLVKSHAPSNLPGPFPPFFLDDLYISVRKYSTL
jgi:hypothetical protein